MFKTLNKVTRVMNKVNRTAKDARMVTDFATGNTKRATRRLKNKAKGKLVNKIFKWLG